MKKTLFAMVAFVGSLLAAPAAQAGFLYVDIFDGTTTLSVVDGGPDDLDGIVNDSIIVSSSALLAAFGTKIVNGSSVNVSSNQATSAVDGLSSLSANYTLKGVTGVSSDFTITAGQTGFTVPGDPRAADTSGSFVFTNSGLLGNGTFQGSVGSTDGASDLFDTLVTATSSTNLPNFGGGNGTGFVFSNGDNPYSMTNVLTAHIVATKNATVQGQGTTIVSAAPPVPEPSTIVMLATMVGPLAVGLYRRRRTAR